MLLLVFTTINLLLLLLTPLLVASLRLCQCYSLEPETWNPDRLATVQGDREVMLLRFCLACMPKVAQSANLQCISLVRLHGIFGSLLVHASMGRKSPRYLQDRRMIWQDEDVWPMEVLCSGRPRLMSFPNTRC